MSKTDDTVDGRRELAQLAQLLERCRWLETFCFLRGCCCIEVCMGVWLFGRQLTRDPVPDRSPDAHDRPIRIYFLLFPYNCFKIDNFSRSPVWTRPHSDYA